MKVCPECGPGFGRMKRMGDKEYCCSTKHHGVRHGLIEIGEPYIIGAKSLEDAERIASTYGLRRYQWKYAYCGTARQLKDGLGMVSEDRLLGEFRTGERFVLTGKH